MRLVFFIACLTLSACSPTSPTPSPPPRSTDSLNAAPTVPTPTPSAPDTTPPSPPPRSTELDNANPQAPSPEPEPAPNPTPNPTPTPTPTPNDGLLGPTDRATFDRDGAEHLRLTEAGAGWRFEPWRFVVHVERRVGDTWQRGVGLDGHPRSGPTALATGDAVVGLVAFTISDGELVGTWVMSDGDDRAGLQTATPKNPTAGLAQTYAVMGENRGPGRYSGTLTIAASAEPTRYELTWKLGATRTRGVGLRHGPHLFACWSSTDSACTLSLVSAVDLEAGVFASQVTDSRTPTLTREPLTRRLAPPAPNTHRLTGLTGVELADDGRLLASRCIESRCETVPTPLMASSGPAPLPPPEGPIPTLADSPCDSTDAPVRVGELIATRAQWERVLCFFEAATGARLRTHEVQAPAVGRLLASPPGPSRYLAAESFAPEDPETPETSRPRFVEVFASPSARRVGRTRGTLPQPLGAFAPDASALLTLELDGTLHLVALPSGETRSPSERYQLAAFAPDGALIGVTLDGRVQHLAATDAAPLATLTQVHGRLHTPLVFSNDGRSVAFATRSTAHLVRR